VTGIDFIVVGGGSTIRDYDVSELHQHAYVIGVNDAALWVDGTSECVTMDRLWFENRWAYLRMKRIATWVRQKCDCNVPRVDKRDDWKTFVHLNSTLMAPNPGALNGSNSGTCAINLAFQRMRPNDNLYLLGFDMCKGPNGEPYWYPPYPWASPAGATKDGHFKSWAAEFDAIYRQFRAEQKNIFNVTHRSAIEAFPKLTFNDMIWKLAGE